MTSIWLQRNLNVLFFQCALTVQMAQKFKTSEPAAGHVTRKIDPLNFTLKQSNLVYRLPAPTSLQSVTPLYTLLEPIVFLKRNSVCFRTSLTLYQVKVGYFQKKIGIIYRLKQICRFTILDLSFEFSRFFLLLMSMELA